MPIVVMDLPFMIGIKFADVSVCIVMLILVRILILARFVSDTFTSYV